MPEVIYLLLPPQLLASGVNDMVRISDAHMSGARFGTTVLHIAPESAVGGPPDLVETRDAITLLVPSRSLHLHMDYASYQEGAEHGNLNDQSTHKARQTCTIITRRRPMPAATSLFS